MILYKLVRGDTVLTLLTTVKGYKVSITVKHEPIEEHDFNGLVEAEKFFNSLIEAKKLFKKLAVKHELIDLN